MNGLNKTLTIKDFMTEDPYTIGQDQTLTAAHQMMREYSIRHLPVLNGNRLVGILSQRDLFLVETLKDVHPDEVLVSEAMTEVPMSVPPGALLVSVAAEMADKKYGAAIVVENGKVVGIFTTVDALRALDPEKLGVAI
jgi:acetoin utilization protein AcuB